MNFQDAAIILEVMKTQNISKAAANLYLSQSTISTRIKQVEEELGTELFLRGKGQRSLTLTEAGREFLPVAQHIRAAQEKIDQMKGHVQTALKIASNESTYYEVIQPFCIDFKRKHPEVQLSIQIKDTSYVYEMLESGTADIGFASYNAGHVGIEIQTLYEQHWCIISGRDLANENGVVDPKDLNPTEEIFYNVGDLEEIYRWRQNQLGSMFVGTIQTNSFIESIDFICEFGGWELATMTWAKKMLPLGNYRIYQIKERPDSRRICQLTPSSKLQREIELIFEEELHTWLKHNRQNMPHE